jgi:hypothetical protein
VPLNPDPTVDPIAASEVLRPLVALVVKQGVGLGGLTEPAREQALAVVWAALPTAPCSERAINDALREALAGPARFIDTDHVELRRWLVDTGWLSRDGFGREYRAVALAALPPGRQPLARALVAAGPHWPQAQRERFEAERAARRARWAAAQAGSPGAPG